jgi:hypothetical protein
MKLEFSQQILEKYSNIKCHENLSKGSRVDPFRRTRQEQNFHLPSVHLRKYQSGPYYMGLKLYNDLPAFFKNGVF